MSEAESRAQEIFLTAQKQSDEMRDAFLQAACAGDASLLAEVDKLMISHQKSGGSASPIAGSSGTVGESPEELAAKIHKAPPPPPTDLKMHTIAGRYKMIH